MERPEDTAFYEESGEELMLRLLAESLRTDDATFNALASAVYVHMGSSALLVLAEEVMDCRRPTKYRLRVLQVIEQIGPRRHYLAFVRLCNLLRDRDEQVRLAAERVLCTHGGPSRRAEPANPRLIADATPMF